MPPASLIPAGLALAATVGTATIAAADHADDDELEKLSPQSVYQLDIEGPSGLTLDRSGEFLWAVSDIRNDGIYRIDFEGEIQEKLPEYRGHDLEGITQNSANGTLSLAEERLREVANLEQDGSEIERFKLEVPVTERNSGLEGIAWNPAEGELFIANQTHPRLLMRIGSDGKLRQRAHAEFPPPYDIEDLSGLWYDHRRDELYIVSNSSSKLLILDSNFHIQRGYRLDREKYEGIAVDHERGRLYLVNDREDTLSVFALPSARHE